jgi:Peptidase family M28
MDATYRLVMDESLQSKSGASSALSIVICSLIALVVACSIYRQTPPDAVSASAPLTEFSSGRAMQRLEVIARKPHPIGSQEHALVRDYILKELAAAGLNPEIQETTAINSEESEHIRAGTVRNIVAKLPGTANTKAILLAGHYDSVPNGSGASDDGAAVVAMLETLSALKATAPLKNDVIFLFTDGEESGLLGAYAFVAEHPLAKDVGLVFNFEARGTSGPAIMFETSDQNGWLIQEFAKAAPYPIAHSLSYEIYRRLPNDTDLSVFKQAQMPGLNFAYIDGLTHYHTQLDSINEIDERSLQHEGSTALALARHFGDLNLADRKSTNAVYFDVLGLALVHYSSALVVPLSLITVLLFSVLIVVGLRRGRLTLSGMLRGFLAFLLSLIAAPVVVTVAWTLIQKLHDVPGVRPQGEAYNNNFYLLSFVAVTIAITSALYILFRKKISSENLIVGILIWWALLLLLVTFSVPGATYLLTWPLLFSLPALTYMLVISRRASSVKLLLLFSIASISGIILVAPVVYQTFIGLTLKSIGWVMIMVVLLLGLLVPYLPFIAAPRKWLLPGASALISLLLILFASLNSGYDARHPRFDTMLYGLSADSGRAIWASSDKQPDAWTRQFLSSEMKQAPLNEIFSKFSSRPFLQSPAATESLPAPHIELLDDRTQNDVRILRMRVTSPRQMPVMSIYLDSAAEVVGSSVNGKRINPPASVSKDADWDLRYYAVPQEGVEISLEVKSAEPIKLRLVDQTYGLPKVSAPRPEGIIAAPFSYNDSTFVSKSFVF